MRKMILLILGLLLMASSFVIGHYFTPVDFVDGLIKGISIGLMILGVFFLSKQMATKSVKS